VSSEIVIIRVALAREDTTTERKNHKRNFGYVFGKWANRTSLTVATTGMGSRGIGKYDV
jgi:hypothetical protein